MGLGIVLEALVTAPTTHLWVVGRGDEGAFTAEAKRLGVAGRVTFMGPRPDIERYYQAADVFVLPSRYEAFSLGSHEAAACGLPLLVTQVNGVDELIGNGEAGRLIERSGEALGGALWELSSDRQARRRMSRAARERALAFTWDASAESVLNLYDELLASVHKVQEIAA
jgi:glycosyltransferase involved in cell wall biosynthesis